MLLTLTATCMRPLLLGSAKSKRGKLDLLDLPVFTREQLGLSGINLSTDLLAGADRARLTSFRDRADRAGCAMLLLIEPEPQPIGGTDDKAGEGATSRLLRVVEAAHVLGCTAASVSVQSLDDDPSLLRVASRLKPVMARAERLDLNLVISPAAGLTERPERVTELLKKVGGFRIGTYPDFESASKAKDPSAYLHRLTPYATVICAATQKFVPAGKKSVEPGAAAVRDGSFVHAPYDLKAMVKSLQAVGYDGPLGVDYRGGGDVTMGVQMSREALLMALGQELFEEPA